MSDRYIPPSPKATNFRFYSYTPPDWDAVNFIIRNTQIYDGKGYFSGVVRKDSNIDGIAMIRVFDPTNGTLIRELYTDEFGNYIIEGLNSDYSYDVVAYDIDGNWEAKLFTNRRPAF